MDPTPFVRGDQALAAPVHPVHSVSGHRYSVKVVVTEGLRDRVALAG